jgi:RNA ligase (TIGR02306 family)
MSNSTHDIVVVRLEAPIKHENAERLEIWKIFDSYRVISQKDLYHEGDLVAYIPPDNIVPDTEEWAWLEGKRRIKAKKLRGVISYGLITKAPEGSKEGDIVTEQMGITHYDPEVHGEVKFRGPEGPKPEGFYPKYDIDALLRYSRLFVPGEQVWVTEKLHGSNCQAVFKDGQLYVKSRNRWPVDEPGDIFWTAVRNTPGLVDWLEEHPGLTVCGEVVPCAKAGGVSFTYGKTPGQPELVLFDIHQNGEYLSHELARGISQNLQWVPCLGMFPFSIEQIEELATGKTLMPGANHLREGVVITPVDERNHPTLGRIKLKLVSHKFLEL